MEYCKNISIYLLFCIISFEVCTTNSRTSSLWALNKGKITGFDDKKLAFKAISSITNDEAFKIISSTVVNYDNVWTRNSETNFQENIYLNKKELLKSETVNCIENNIPYSDPLECGKPVNFTYYDYLVGVAQRFSHPNNIPEPEVIYQFLRNKDEKSFKSFDINTLEKRLRKVRKEKPKSVNLLNQIGNYWRIKGDARKSIECFRKALSISPTNAEVLLNLARLLFNLQYLDDAIHLTRRSLEVQPPDRSAWRHYFTLGEIFKAYGHLQESLIHLRHALELHPQHQPILKALRDVENIPNSSLHIYTIFIIIVLVLAVFIVIFTSTDGNSNASHTEFDPKIQRHFNRAMAMRSLKGFPSRALKHRK